jgi:predicted small metal-binding protein
MRGFDCRHEAHEDIHFSASSDDELVEQLKRHRDEYHTEMSDDQIREAVTQGAYDE